ncbi:MAG: fumarate hydratase C-terminal domain-containing protein [Spirochaetales bacterium]|nr:fumarate hydratase C-terminal domain-containing protein [Spirochaetales bacterium]
MTWTTIRLYTPINDSDLETLKAGDRILLNGEMYTARDQAHKRIIESMEREMPLPFDLQGATIFYAGPSPAPPGKIIGSVGPTTSIRMDKYALELMEKAGIKAMIGKGGRSPEFREACKKYKCVYFSATGGIAALLSQKVKSSELVAYEDLGPEAILKFRIEDFPVIVINDIHGNDYYEIGSASFKKNKFDRFVI